MLFLVGYFLLCSCEVLSGRSTKVKDDDREENRNEKEEKRKIEGKEIHMVGEREFEEKVEFQEAKEKDEEMKRRK